MKISDALLPEFDQEMANTRKMLDRVPDNKLGWKPHAKSFTLGALAIHIATMPGWAVSIMQDASFDYAPPGQPPMQQPNLQSRKEILDTFDQGVTDSRAALAAASDEQFLTSWSLLAGGKTLFTMPRGAVIRSFVINHIIHHRAQLGVYFRLNDVAVPGMYGPSADEATTTAASS